MAFITRFAPSPTGRLHLGHAYSALVADAAAKAENGTFLLRLEDIDRTRCKPEFEDGVYEDLAWLGLSWPAPVRRQSDHFDAYAAALQTLQDKGLVYRCFKTRKEVLAEIANAPHLGPAGPEGPAYIGAPLPAAEERALVDAGAPHAWRLSLAAARETLGAAWADLSFQEGGRGPNGETGKIRAAPEMFGDIIIARKDAGTSYHLAAVHDDAAQGVTHVIRGEDLFAASHVHVLLQALLDLPQPVYRHHRLITDENGKRYAKRDESVTLRALRTAGQTPAAVKAQLGF